MQILNSDLDDRAVRLLDSEVIRQLETIRRAVPHQSRPLGRFDIYGFLQAVYETYRLWKRQSAATKTARKIARALRIPLRAGVSPIRVLIEATYADADPKQKSRWVRALQQAHDEHTAPEKLLSFIRCNGGIAGCAARAAQNDPKKLTDRDDWA